MSAHAEPDTREDRAREMEFDAGVLACPGVRKLEPYQPGKPIEELEREYGIRGAIKLASNENPLGAGARAVEALRDYAATLGRYPDGNGFALRQKLAARFGIEMDRITLGNGSNDILELVARAFVTPEHEVIYSAHAFAVYPIVTQAVGAHGVVTPAREWGHDLEAMRAAVTDRTRLIFVANPNNPTGTWLAAAALRRFVESVPRTVIVVVDEAYAEYVTAPGYPDCMAWIADFPNLVVTRTFSKIHGLAALRVGYGVSHPRIADLLNRVRQPFNVNGLALAAAAAALDDAEHIARSRAVNSAGLVQITKGIEGLGLTYIPSVANFLTVDLGRSAGPIYEGLLREGVIVRPIGSYGMPRHLRVTVGTEAENARFLAALGRVLEADPAGL